MTSNEIQIQIALLIEINFILQIQKYRFCNWESKYTHVSHTECALASCTIRHSDHATLDPHGCFEIWLKMTRRSMMRDIVRRQIQNIKYKCEYKWKYKQIPQYAWSSSRRSLMRNIVRRHTQNIRYKYKRYIVCVQGQSRLCWASLAWLLWNRYKVWSGCHKGLGWFPDTCIWNKDCLFDQVSWPTLS